MFKVFKRKKKTVSQEEENRQPYEARESLHALSLFFIIVNRDQSKFFVDAFAKMGVSLSLVQYGYSNPPQEIIALLGSESTKKDIIISVVRSEDINKLKKTVQQRFNISKAAKGIAFACPIDSVSGISIYRFLADQDRTIREEHSHGRKK